MDLALSVFANSERTTSVDTDCCSAGAADLSERRRSSGSGGRVHLVAPARGMAESGWHDFNRSNPFNAATGATGAMWVGRIPAPSGNRYLGIRSYRWLVVTRNERGFLTGYGNTQAVPFCLSQQKLFHKHS